MTGTCPICLRYMVLVSDHDHNSGLFRGNICKTCNLGIGCFLDQTDWLGRAIAYLEATRPDPEWFWNFRRVSDMDHRVMFEYKGETYKAYQMVDSGWVVNSPSPLAQELPGDGGWGL